MLLNIPRTCRSEFRGLQQSVEMTSVLPLPKFAKGVFSQTISFLTSRLVFDDKASRSRLTPNAVSLVYEDYEDADHGTA